MAKSNDSEFQDRVEQVKKMQIKLWSNSKIFQYISKKTDWNVSTRQVYNYIKEAKEQIKAEPQDKKFDIAIAKKNIAELHQRNMAIEDYKEVRALIETQAKLFGWNEPEKTDVTTNGKDMTLKNLIGFEKTEDDN